MTIDKATYSSITHHNLLPHKPAGAGWPGGNPSHQESDANGDIPIAALTSFAMEMARKRILATGCNACGESPIDPRP
jgi:hypothetical protein